MMWVMNVLMVMTMMMMRLMRVECATKLGIVDDPATCEAMTTDSDAYWDAVTACLPCVNKGCGYCELYVR